jgi:photosystem II stability/assembly factor-like uncharacterized protein
MNAFRIVAAWLFCGAFGHAASPLSTWTLRSPLPPSNPLRDIVYTNGLWIAVGDGGTVLTSSDDGQTWPRQSLGITNAQDSIRGVAHGGGKFVAVTSYGAALSSANGTNWNLHQLGQPAGLQLAGGTFSQRRQYLASTAQRSHREPCVLRHSARAQLPMVQGHFSRGRRHRRDPVGYQRAGE